MDQEALNYLYLQILDIGTSSIHPIVSSAGTNCIRSWVRNVEVENKGPVNASIFLGSLLYYRLGHEGLLHNSY